MKVVPLRLLAGTLRPGCSCPAAADPQPERRQPERPGLAYPLHHRPSDRLCGGGWPDPAGGPGLTTTVGFKGSVTGQATRAAADGCPPGRAARPPRRTVPAAANRPRWRPALGPWRSRRAARQGGLQHRPFVAGTAPVAPAAGAAAGFWMGRTTPASHRSATKPASGCRWPAEATAQVRPDTGNRPYGDLPLQSQESHPRPVASLEAS